MTSNRTPWQARAPFVLALALTLWHASPAEACKCIPPPPPEEAFQDADAVFVGVVEKRNLSVLADFWFRAKVVAGRLVGADWENDDAYERTLPRFTFRLLSTWKGSATDRLRLVTGHGNGDCGFPFKISERYLVYADADEQGVLYTSICSRTRPEPDAQEDLEFLETVLAPLSDNPAIPLMKGPDPCRNSG